MNRYILFKGIILLALIISCTGPKTKDTQKRTYVVNSEVVHPEWTKKAVIYEVNLRQYTHEGTFDAFAEHLPQLKEMGVDILWLMPVFPVGELNRKVSQTTLIEEIKDPEERKKYLGSYYSTRDYYSVNPEFGTMEDFQDLVTKIHELGMHIILDIAVNHTAWDNEWVTTHPEYYTQVDVDSIPWKSAWMEEHPEYYERIRNLGMTYPIDPNETDWWDVADLNYNSPALRNEMKNVFRYWVSTTDVDGYRCDVAGWVPCDFWNDVRATLDSIKPVFMLAEDEANRCLVEKAFDMYYGWELHHIMNEIVKGNKTVGDLKDYFNRVDSIYDPDIYRMNFITNHDENSWNGTEFERMGEAVKANAMLTFTLPGMPLIYSGQEIGWDKRLLFFEKDEIIWTQSPWESFYADLIRLKKDNPVFWNGAWGGLFVMLPVSGSDNVFAFERSNDEETFVIVANLGREGVDIQIDTLISDKNFTDIYSGENVTLEDKFTVGAFEYKVLKEDN